jgi:hypothetical protein
VCELPGNRRDGTQSTASVTVSDAGKSALKFSRWRPIKLWSLRRHPAVPDAVFGTLRHCTFKPGLRCRSMGMQRTPLMTSMAWWGHQGLPWSSAANWRNTNLTGET